MVINKVNTSSTASGLLDLLRFVSAFTVLALHATSNHSIPGYQAVLVFFVLSGYFVGSSVLHNISTGKWSWKTYLINRVTRLWIVLVPALLLTLIWVSLQSYWLGGAPNDTGFKELLGNLFFLQGENIQEYGNNGPLWSLSYEFWYYMLFPVLILSFVAPNKKQRYIYFGILLLMSVFIYNVLGARILQYFVVWLLGAAISIIPAIRIQSRWIKRGIVAVSSIIAIAGLWVPYAIVNHEPLYVSEEPYIPDVVIGLCFSMFMYFLISFYNNTSLHGRKDQLWTYLAGFSYTLYLTHYPILNIVEAWMKKHPHTLLNSEAILIQTISYAVLFLFCIGYAWMISRFTENKIPQIRGFIKRQLFVETGFKIRSQFHAYKNDDSTAG